MFLDHRGRDFAQLLHQFIRKTLARKCQISELLRIRHPASAIPFFHQRVFSLHLFAGHVLGRRELVLNDFEDKVVGWQGKDTHHHALNPRGDTELVVGIRHMPKSTAMVIGFSMLIVPHGTVNLGNGFCRHKLLKEQNILSGPARIYQEIGSSKTKQHADLIRTK